MNGSFRFGIEEEYFLADRSSGETPSGRSADAFHDAASGKVAAASHEFLKGQVEIQTEPLTDLDAACASLRAMRQDLSAVADEHGLSMFAAGTHPLARTGAQEATPDKRYRRLENELGVIAMRAMICAMHVHVEAPEPDKRIALMNRLMPFLPLLYALSVSSPFWQGREAGLKGIRLSAFSEWPRMGLPEIFRDEAEYKRYVDLLVKADVVDDSSFIWWYIRPSERFPTIEMRICDSCTRVEDAVAIAALYQALVRCASRRPDLNAGVGAVDRGVCASNIWLVQQHGLDASLVDLRGGALPIARLLDETIDLVAEDMDALGSTAWVLQTRDILRRGTGADSQLATYRDATENGASSVDALRAVVAMLARETAG